MNKKIVIIAISGLFLFFIAIAIGILYLFSQGQIEDTNGSLTELTTINLIEEVQNNTFTSSWASTTRRYSGNTSGVNPRYEDEDYDYIKYKVNKMSGVDTLQATMAKRNERLSIEIDCQLKRGNLEIIIVDPNNELVKKVTTFFNGQEIVTIEHTLEGMYRVIVGGESAEFTMIIERSKTLEQY